MQDGKPVGFKIQLWPTTPDFCMNALPHYANLLDACGWADDMKINHPDVVTRTALVDLVTEKSLDWEKYSPLEVEGIIATFIKLRERGNPQFKHCGPDEEATLKMLLSYVAQSNVEQCRVPVSTNPLFPHSSITTPS